MSNPDPIEEAGVFALTAYYAAWKAGRRADLEKWLRAFRGLDELYPAKMARARLRYLGF